MSGADLIQFSVACWVIFGSAGALIFALITLFDILKSLRLALNDIRSLTHELRRPDTRSSVE